MAGLDADTSSYPKPGLPVSPLDIAQKFGNLQQQKLQIDQSKLDQANQALGYMTRAMGSLGPDASKDDYEKVGQNAVDMGLVPQNMLSIYTQRLQAAPTAKDFFNEFITAAQGHQEQINYHLGQPGVVSNGQTDTPVATSVKPGFGQRPIGLPVQQQPPPTAIGNVNGQPTALGAQPPQLAPGTVAQPTPLPVQRPGGLPAGPITSPALQGQSSNFGGNVVAANVEPTTNAATGAPQANPQPRGYAAGPPPNFEVGQKMYAVDQANATSKATALKPLEEAYDLAKSVSTGPGTETLNKARSYLVNAGVIKADQTSPTVIYAELNKNLAQFVDKNGSRSDADLAVKESGNANAKTQVQPALLHMVQKIIGRERIEIARPQAFGSSDYQNYGKHSASFPTSQDERAYSIDKLPPDEAKRLYADMRTKALAGNAEGIKFMKSLATAKKTNQVTGLGQ